MLPGLVVGRRTGETVWIDREIAVTVVRAKNGQCRLHIHAPQSMKIVRQELLDRTTQVVADDGVLSEAHEREVERKMIEHG